MLRLVLASLTSGAAYALLGLGLVLLFRMSGTLNFALGAIGAVATFTALTALGPQVHVLVFLVVAALVGVLLGVLVGAMYTRWFLDKGVIIRSTATIPLLVGLLALSFRVFGDSPRTVSSLLPGRLQVAGVSISHDTVLAVGLVLVLYAVARLVLDRTRIGAQLRAVADNPITAELVGVRVGLLTIGVWAATSLLGTLAVIVVAPTRPASITPLAMLILPALAAALVGGFEHLGPTVAAGFVVAILEGLGSGLSVLAPYRELVPFLFIVLILLYRQRGEVWDDAR